MFGQFYSIVAAISIVKIPSPSSRLLCRDFSHFVWKDPYSPTRDAHYARSPTALVTPCEVQPCPHRLERPVSHTVLFRLRTAGYVVELCGEENHSLVANENFRPSFNDTQRQLAATSPLPRVSRTSSLRSTPAGSRTASPARTVVPLPSTLPLDAVASSSVQNTESRAPSNTSSPPTTDNEHDASFVTTEGEPLNDNHSPINATPASPLHPVSIPPAGTPSDVEMTNAQELQDLRNQQTAQAQVLEQLLKQLTEKAGASRSPIKEPEPFKGQMNDARRFLRFFTNWASNQRQPLQDTAGKRNDRAWISSALSFMQGDAANWASRFLQQIVDHDAAEEKDKASKPWPFNGSWPEFTTQFNARFQPADDKEAAQQELDNLAQGRSSVAQFAAKFQEVFARTGLSEEDGMSKFKRKLNRDDKLWLAMASMVKKPTTLQELVNTCISNEFVMRNAGVDSPRSSGPSTSSTPARDPYAMDIDATRVGPNGRSRDDYVAMMRGRCFGCGSRDHIKRDGDHTALRCTHCQRMGHTAGVCQDRFMGFPTGRGLRSQPHRRVRATTMPFALEPDNDFDVCSPRSSAPTSSIAASSSSPTPTPSIPPDVQRFAETMTKLTEGMAKVNQDF
ncbi:hypothetical protein CC2G_013607 [Coprinopsis cinerea AmutBmut pab1-1]|nr:hypothetical protein CC2G_013607 [Coprinopsis cinerea AmutBmut pab1-1]